MGGALHNFQYFYVLDLFLLELSILQNRSPSPAHHGHVLCARLAVQD